MRFIVSYVLAFLIYGFSLLAIEGESSFPYLSGNTWRFFCDWRLTKNDQFVPENVQVGATIFVEYECLEEFAASYLTRIEHPFILISSNYGIGADNPLPGPYSFLLAEEKIVAWFVQNIDQNPSEKLIPIPIGIATKHYSHGNTDLLDQHIPNALLKNNKRWLCYVNFSVGTNRKEREGCLRFFLKKPWAKVVKPKSFPYYLSHLTESAFVVSPPGNGLDCHRTWEALLMGCYPIVKSSTLNPLYEELPVVIVEDWSEITESFLLEKYKEFKKKSYSRERLFAPYWFDRVKKIQQQIRERS
jgi:hypothetical protein